MPETPDFPDDDELASWYADEIWRYAESVVGDDEIVTHFGFANRESISDVVIAIRAGDRLHPRNGFDYLDADWQEENEDRIFEQLSERDNEVEKILEDVLSRLESDGYESAYEVALKSSPFQVIYLSRSKAETKRDLNTLLSLGLGRNELSDNLREKRGSTLVIGYDEAISYFASD